MVEITFRKGSYGYEYFKMVNHAEKSIVCAGVTSLGMALVGSLMNFPDVKYSINKRNEALIELEIQPFYSEKKRALCDAIFSTVYIGLGQLAKSYPDDIWMCAENTGVNLM